MSSADQRPIDRVFEGEGSVKPFEFNETVAHVFDDMAERSIPHYREVQRMVTTLAATFYQKGTAVYDLGCSTGTTMALIHQALTERGAGDHRLIGIDNSAAMCREAEEKLSQLNAPPGCFDIREADLNEIPLENASVVVMNYTLQFVDPLVREKLVEKIYAGLKHNGVLIVSDKISQSHTDSSRIFVDNYYHMKRQNGYSEMEISRKREALENVLIPYTMDEETDLFRRCGFEGVDIFFTWFNFTSFLCLKKG